ncbi:MAG: site-specific integrase [Thermoanaerobaculia bacterium]|nr:site-specific integrase [Thermoanaerobaculia bacterium]
MPLWRDPKTQKWKMRYYSTGTKAGPRVLETLPSHLTHAEATRTYKARLARAAGRRGKGITHDLTMTEAVAEYMASRKGSYAPQTFRNVGMCFTANVLRLLGDRRLDSLRPSDFIAYGATRTEEGAAPGTVNREFELMRAMFNVLLKWEWIERTPMPAGSVPRLRAPKNRVDFLAPDEWRAFLRALETTPDAPTSVFRYQVPAVSTIPVFRALLYTGARLGEILSLRWEAVDLDRGRIVLDRRKTQSVTGLTISEPLREVLEGLPRGTPAALVFRRPDGQPWIAYNIQGHFSRARDRAGLRKTLTVHSLRHTFASWLVADGVPLRTVSELLGHSNIVQTSRYAHLAPEHLREAVDRIGRLEGSGVSPAPREGAVIPLDERRKAGC